MSNFDRYRRNLKAYAQKTRVSKAEARMSAEFKYLHARYKRLSMVENKSPEQWQEFTTCMDKLGINEKEPRETLTGWGYGQQYTR